MNDREQFEAWAAAEYGIANFDKGTSGGYVNSKTHIRWEAWQAARATPAQPVPTNEEFDALWKKHADFAADVLEQWGGWPMGLLGQGGSGTPSPATDASAPSPSSVGAAIRALPLPDASKFLDFVGVELSSWEKELFTRGALAMRSEAAALAEQVQGQPIAYMRKWAFDGEKPYKVKNGNGRMAWAGKFRFKDVTSTKVFPDDVPLYAAAPSIAQDGQKSEADHG